jgi:hypothetical protein
MNVQDKNFESVYHNVDRANAHLICEIVRIQDEREKRGNELCAKAVDMEKFLLKIQDYLHKAVNEMLEMRHK